MAIRSPSRTPLLEKPAAIDAVRLASSEKVTDLPAAPHTILSGRSCRCRSSSSDTGAISSVCNIVFLRPSDHAETAADADHLACDPATGIRREKGDHGSHVGRLAETADRIRLDELIVVRIHPSSIMCGFDQAE